MSHQPTYVRIVFAADPTISGLHSFGPLVLVVRPPVYIPRVETEQWVLLLAAHILSSTPPTPIIRILDICSGTGCIPLLLAQQGGGRIHTVGLDVDDRALTIARENIKRNQLDQVSSFEKFDLFEDDVPALRERLGAFDVVISNPPYVSSADMRKVEGKWPEGNFALQGKLKTESTNGDAGDDDGLSFYRRIHDIYTSLLSPDRPSAIPKLVLEVGSTQSPPVKAMYEGEGRQEVHKETARRKDLSTPKLEEGDTIGTERCIWIYDR